MKTCIKHISRVFICFAITLSLLSGSISPVLIVALENERALGHMLSVLDTDLSVYEGERVPYSTHAIGDGRDFSNLDILGIVQSSGLYRNSESQVLPLIDEPYEDEKPLSRQAMWEDQTYETDRFIVKYKETAPNETAVFTVEPVKEPINLDILPQNGIIVALMDTGVDTNHTALDGKLTAGYDFVNNTDNVNSEEWYYDQAHGTGMAGAIASGGAVVTPLKVFEGGKAYSSDIISAIVFAEENGASKENAQYYICVTFYNMRSHKRYQSVFREFSTIIKGVEFSESISKMQCFI